MTVKDYHAMLTLYGWPKLSEKGRKSVIAWLKRITKELETEDPNIFNHKRFIARYMKG